MRISYRNTAILSLVSHGLVSVTGFQPGQTPKAGQNSETSLPVATSLPAPLKTKVVEIKVQSPKSPGLNHRVSEQTGSKTNATKSIAMGAKTNYEEKEFHWLYWFYKQWRDRPVAHVEKSILKEFLPAAQCWKGKQSRLGARRASELVERYGMEYLSGNPHATMEASTTAHSQTYFSKLLRVGLDSWLHAKDEPEPIPKAHALLDKLAVMADRAIHENKHNDGETVARAKILHTHIQEHRVSLQVKSLKSGDSVAGPQIAELLHKALSFTEGRTGRHLEDSLVAMQQLVISLDTLVADVAMMDAYERELVFTMPEQELLLQSSAWLSVALPVWEFLYHSLIRALIAINEPERADRCLQRMQDMLHRRHEAPSLRPEAQVAMERILRMDEEGKNLLILINKDRQGQWLHWLSFQLSNTAVGELSDSFLKLVMPAIYMHAKRKTKKDAERAQELLKRYVEEFKVGNPMAILTNKYFNCVCDAWAKLGDPDRAQSVLDDMAQLRCDCPDNTDLKPDVISLSTLAAAWANKKSPEAARRAEQILLRMEDEGLNPTTIAYNTVLRALIHSPGVNKAMRAEEIIQRMEQRYEAGHTECKPSIRTYQSLISAWSRTDLSGTAQKAEQVLNFLDTKSQEMGFSDLAPNTHCFAAAIHSWAYSQEEQKARRAYNILIHMRDLYEQHGKEECRPNVVSYTAVINACASPCLESEKFEAYQIAQLAMDELWHYGGPNYLTFAAYLRVCETTLEKGSKSDDVVRSVFSKCCEAGQVGEVVIEKLKRAASNELYRELIVDTGAECVHGKLNLFGRWTRCVTGAQYRIKPTKTGRQYFPENQRLREVRVLKGTVGQYSEGKDENATPVSF